MDENFINSQEDEHSPIEQTLLDNIRDQICNIFGEYTGDISSEPDIILEYFSNYHSGDDHTIRNFEAFCKDNDLEENYDIISHGLVRLFKQYIGINIDLDREDVYFEDLYDIYLIFVLDLRNTVLTSYNNHFYKTGNVENIPLNIYYSSDDFHPTDDFILNAAYSNSDIAINNINNKILDFVINFDNDKFCTFINDFIKNSEL